MSESKLCSCGCAENHVIAVRETADGKRVRLWSDGEITHACVGDPYVRGIGQGRSAFARERYRLATLDITEDIGLFALAELATLVRVARSFRMAGSRYDNHDALRTHIRVRASALCAEKSASI